MKKLLVTLLAVGLAGCLSGPVTATDSRSPSEIPGGKTQQPTGPAESIPTQTIEPANQSAGQEEYPEILELVVRDLAFRLEIDLNDIEVVSIQETEWPNSGIGCELPGTDYTQVITPGYRFQLAVQDEIYTYHTDRARSYVLCQGGLPQFPPIPVDPDEIMDGVPWMPVDPLPTVEPGDTLTDPDPIK